MKQNHSILVRALGLLNQLSLDAPLAAVAWLALIEGIDSLHLSWSRYLVLFLACWMAYVADRTFDAIRLGREGARGRHAFYSRHLRIIVPIWLILAALTFALAWRVLLPQTFVAGIGIGILTGLHYLAVRLGLRRRKHFLLKETSVSIIFSTGVLIFAWERMPGWSLLQQHALFFLLCMLNITLISSREMAREETGQGFPRKRYERASLVIGAIIMITAIPLAATGLAALGLAAVLCVAAMLWISLKFSHLPHNPYAAAIDAALALPAILTALLIYA